MYFTQFTQDTASTHLSSTEFIKLKDRDVVGHERLYILNNIGGVRSKQKMTWGDKHRVWRGETSTKQGKPKVKPGLRKKFQGISVGPKA